MSIVLVRVDNRLVHGQILAAWVPVLSADSLLVLDDETAGNTLLRSAMEISIPPGVSVDTAPLTDVAGAVARLPTGSTIVLLRDVADAAKALAGGLPIARLNLGNVHYSHGREPITQAVYLSPEEIVLLEGLEAKGVPVEIKTLPSDAPISLAEAKRADAAPEGRVTGSAVALAAAVGGLLSVERKTVGQFMLARPIVAAPIIGALLGDARQGLELGIPLELAFLGTASFGASTPYHESLAALFGAALAVTATASAPTAARTLMPLAFFLALPVAVLGRSAEAALERWNSGLAIRAQVLAANGQPDRATRQALFGIVGPLVLGVVATAFGAFAGPACGTWFDHGPAWLVRGLRYSWPLVLGASAGMAARTFRTKRAALWSAVAATTAIGLWLLSGVRAR